MEFTQVEEEYYMKIQENIEFYETAINLIKDELYGIESLENEYIDTVEEIKQIVKELEDELNIL